MKALKFDDIEKTFKSVINNYFPINDNTLLSSLYDEIRSRNIKLIEKFNEGKIGSMKIYDKFCADFSNDVASKMEGKLNS